MRLCKIRYPDVYLRVSYRPAAYTYLYSLRVHVDTQLPNTNIAVGQITWAEYTSRRIEPLFAQKYESKFIPFYRGLEVYLTVSGVMFRTNFYLNCDLNNAITYLLLINKKP